EEQADQVEPGRAPADALAAEDRAPVIKAASSRISGSDLAHGRRHQQREDRADDPADADRTAAAGAEGHGIGADTAGENADDRERTGKILDPAHAPGQFLGITHAMEDFYVLIMVT